MTIRRYLSPRASKGLPYPTQAPSIATVTSSYVALDGHDAGPALVEADVTNGQHTSIMALPGVTYLPLELDLDAPISGLTNAQRTAIRAALEAIHVPLEWATGTTTVREILRFAVRRLLLKQHLSADDWNEGLDTTVSDIPLAKRNRIRDALQARGIDTSVIQGSDTIRVLLRKVAVQTIPTLATHLD